MPKLTKTQWLERQQQWRAYGEWAASQPLVADSPEDTLADVGAILEWLPADVRNADRDPERLGVRRMHFVLGLLYSR